MILPDQITPRRSKRRANGDSCLRTVSRASSRFIRFATGNEQKHDNRAKQRTQGLFNVANQFVSIAKTRRIPHPAFSMEIAFASRSETTLIASWAWIISVPGSVAL